MYMLNAENVMTNTGLNYTDHILTATNTIQTSKNDNGRITGYDCHGTPHFKNTCN